MKKLLTLLMVVSLLCAAGTGCGKAENKGLTLLDRNGQSLCTAYEIKELYADDRWAFFEIAVTEAVEQLAQLWDISLSDAQKALFANGYRITTTFDPTAFKAVQTGLQTAVEGVPYGCALTDLQGELLAVYSTKDEKYTNHTQQARAPYSAFKVLSVYTPAVERGIVNWSSVYEDSPYKQVKDSSGKLQDWPANATGEYAQQPTTVYQALRTSLNTVAVKCLQDVGVAQSVAFLQKSFDIPLREEGNVIRTYGEEEVLGSIALGYLETGVSPVQMAGYYQIFATGGEYTPPAAVKQITDETGAAVYVRNPQPRQVISPETADVMNRMLQGVVKPGGTGVKANCSGVEVAGKTGTGDDNADNWFVGVTPGYSCAVWHGQSDANCADNMFSAVIGELYGEENRQNRSFITHKNLHQIAYCTRSGQALSPGCSRIELGFYKQPDALQTCSACVK